MSYVDRITSQPGVMLGKPVRDPAAKSSMIVADETFDRQLIRWLREEGVDVFSIASLFLVTLYRCQLAISY